MEYYLEFPFIPRLHVLRDKIIYVYLETFISTGNKFRVLLTKDRTSMLPITSYFATIIILIEKDLNPNEMG